MAIVSNKPLSKWFKSQGIKSLLSACEYIAQLPYKRISDKSNTMLVLQEQCGTCSSKHALIKKLAEENNYKDLQLFIGIYKMNPRNTPGIATAFSGNAEYIPEAHTYLKCNDKRMDFTSENRSNLNDNDFLEEIEVTPEQVISQKENIHKDFLKKWCNQKRKNFEKIWREREACIQALSR